jgi:uncharacterized protein YndB with AHSA1/START domain
MTRARALKQVIRDRAAKTGERYTTARRHILRELNQTSQRAQGAQSAQRTTKTKSVMSDAAFLKKTGHGLDHWFAVLDRFGAVEKGHTASARHLYEEHGVDGWYAQGITVSYERERGVRAVNQRCDGAFEVSASKTLNATTKQVVKAFTDARGRASWVAEADAKLAGALGKGVSDKKSKGFVIRPDGLARFRYKWDDTTVQLYIVPKPGNKVAITVQHTKLPSGDSVELYRGQWKTALGLLADHFTA